MEGDVECRQELFTVEATVKDEGQKQISGEKTSAVVITLGF